MFISPDSPKQTISFKWISFFETIQPTVTELRFIFLFSGSPLFKLASVIGAFFRIYSSLTKNFHVTFSKPIQLPIFRISGILHHFLFCRELFDFRYVFEFFFASNNPNMLTPKGLQFTIFLKPFVLFNYFKFLDVFENYLISWHGADFGHSKIFLLLILVLNHIPGLLYIRLNWPLGICMFLS